MQRIKQTVHTDFCSSFVENLEQNPKKIARKYNTTTQRKPRMQTRAAEARPFPVSGGSLARVDWQVSR